MGTLKSFIRTRGIHMSCEWADENPNMGRDAAAVGSHYRCTFRAPCSGKRRSMSTYFSQGPPLTREPTAADVLDCLASDASGYENARTFEEWAEEYGYDTDSRKAEKTFEAVRKACIHLKTFLGSEAYEELLWETERE